MTKLSHFVAYQLPLCVVSLFSQTACLIAVSLSLVAFAPTKVQAAFLNPDGDFGAQTLGSPIGSPWAFVSGGGNSASASAQSPFTNVFANNGIGATTPATTANPYFVGTFAGINSGAGASGLLNFNADFENLSSNLGNGGAYSLLVTNGPDGSQRQATLYVSGTTLYAEGSGGLVSEMTLLADTWYNVNLTLNLATRTFSGTVTQFGGGTTTIAPLGFTTAATTISGIYSDGSTAPGEQQATFAGLVAPDHNIDNFVLMTPEPSTIVLSAIGLIAAVLRGRRTIRTKS